MKKEQEGLLGLGYRGCFLSGKAFQTAWTDARHIWAGKTVRGQRNKVLFFLLANEGNIFAYGVDDAFCASICM